MSWAQEGRERKAKELAKAEVYADKGVGRVSKRPRKPFIVEWKYTEEGWLYMQRHFPWMMRWKNTNDWCVYRKYARKSDAEKAMADAAKKESLSKEYRLREKA